ncbi:MAG: tRNA (adenosine(37)-N6)-threonylcarbamoyltransferase complex transferase subunit TsaD [Desulfobulbaceae bacterium]|nr:tRNA (adenosine(37)-N6)-threonylcarbamoyltransferase complex transferase subunit TsaD [Desulfobulbaceae bacterium]
MLTLAIETSCDDTAAAVVHAEQRRVLSSIISSQHEVHTPFGGIVPELASRRHIEMIQPVVAEALARAGVTLDHIKLIAATQGPGLVGSLLVGFTFAKALALTRNLPCVGVDHLAGHLLSCLLEQDTPSFPYTALIVSGGNTALFRVDSPTSYIRLGRTRDDAAGEAFDKVAKMLHLGYPGGPIIARLAEQGNAQAYAFPRAWLAKDSLDFSFSGLKTAVHNTVMASDQSDETVVCDICASFEEAVVEVLTHKTIMATHSNQHNQVVLGGGVAANKRLRQRIQTLCQQEGLKLFLPSPVFCTDNAAMIALAGYHAYQNGQEAEPDADAYSRSPLH